MRDILLKQTRWKEGKEAVDPRQNLQTVGWKKTSSVALVIALIGPDRKVLIIALYLSL